MIKLHDAIRDRDYSTFKLCIEPSFSNYYDEFASEIYPDTQTITDDHYEAVEASGRVEKFAVREWVCTDTHVGLYLYLVDGAPVCLSYQQGRKCYPEWSFLSKAAWNTVRQLFDDNRPAETNHRISLVDADLMELRLDDEIFATQVSCAQMGLSPIIAYDELLDNIKDSAPDEGCNKVIQEVIDDHNAFIAAATLEFSQEDLARAINTSKVTYDKAVALLNG